MAEGDLNGMRASSSPMRNVESSVIIDDRIQLADEKEITQKEAERLAAHTLAKLGKDSVNLYECIGMMNAIKDRQNQIRRFDEILMRPKYFATREEYLNARAKCSNEALQLDIQVVEIEEKVAAMRKKEGSLAPAAESHDSRQTQARKLETLRLEKFSGTVESWLSFWTRFEERVHKNEKLSNMEKYDYLRQYSTQNVINKLKTIPLSEEFYETAINRLKEEFGSQERVMAHFTEKLLGIQGVVSRYDLEGLRALVQIVKSSLTALQSVGLSADQVSPFFTPILKKAIPVELYLEFKAARRMDRAGDSSNILSSISTSVARDDLVKMVEYLSTVCEDMSAVDSEKLRQLTISQEQRTQEKQQCRMPTVAALPVNQKSESSRQIRRTDSECIFCGDSRHRADSCKKSRQVVFYTTVRFA